MRDATGGVAALSAIAHDVTERRRAVLALARSEERHRLAVESTKLGTWELDVTTGAVTCSPRARELWGLSPDAEMSYEVPLSRVHPDDRGAVDEATRRALDPGGSGEYHFTYRALRADSGVRWIETAGRASFAEVGGSAGRCGSSARSST